MERPTYVPIGRVVKTHGLKGEVSVVPATGLPFVLPEGLQVWFVPPPATLRTAHVEGVRPGPKGPLVKLAEVNDIGAAFALCGSEVLARAEDMPEAWDESDEFDPVGMTVYDERHGDLGVIEEVIVTGANDVWVIAGPLGEILIPVIDQVIIDIDEQEGHIDVHLLDGLLPDEDDEAERDDEEDPA